MINLIVNTLTSASNLRLIKSMRGFLPGLTQPSEAGNYHSPILYILMTHPQENETRISLVSFFVASGKDLHDFPTSLLHESEV